MQIPLAKSLRKRAHLELAMLQDEVVELLYALPSPGSRFVLHGGTAIWRCYSGTRFSEDLDFYGSVSAGFDTLLERELHSRGLSLVKYKSAPAVIFAKISNGIVTVKLEISRAKNPPVSAISTRHYEKTSGGVTDVYTLSPEELILEKIAAYRNRRFIRDIYDVYFLSGQVSDPTAVIRITPQVLDFLSSIEQSVDEKNLRALVYVGVAPSFKEMVAALKRCFGGSGE